MVQGLYGKNGVKIPSFSLEFNYNVLQKIKYTFFKKCAMMWFIYFVFLLRLVTIKEVKSTVLDNTVFISSIKS